MPSVVVIGAGPTGLALASRLTAEKHDVVVLEASARAGGTVRTVLRDDAVLEQGPQALQASARASIRMLLALGLRGQVVEATAAARKRFVLWQGTLREVPRALLDRSFVPRRALLRMLAEALVARKRVPEETVHAFVARRFGATVADRLADPFVAGVFAGDARALEIAAAFPDLVRFEQEKGSVLRAALGRPKPEPLDGAPTATFTFQRGMETFTAAMAAELGPRLRLVAPVERVEVVGRGLRVHASGGPYDAERVFVCAPPGRAAAFVPTLQPELAAIPMAAVAAVHLGWKGLPERDGFGWLAPSSERQDALGCLWVSSTFPTHAPGRRLVRVMMGGPRDPHLPDDPDALALRARRVMRDVEGVGDEPDLVDVNLAAIPQYPPGHTARVARLNAAIPGLAFLGWGYSGIGVEHGVRAATTG